MDDPLFEARDLIALFGCQAAAEALLRAVERHLACDFRASRFWLNVAEFVSEELGAARAAH